MRSRPGFWRRQPNSWHQTSTEETGGDRSDRHYPIMDLNIHHRSRTDSCLGRNAIRLQVSPIRSVPEYSPWPATFSHIFVYNQWPAQLCEFINHQTACWWLSDLQRDPLSARHRRTPIRPRCIADLGAPVADEFSSPEVSTTANHT